MGLARFGPMFLVALSLIGCDLAQSGPAETGQRAAVVQTSGSAAPKGQSNVQAGALLAGGIGGGNSSQRSAEATGSGAELAYVTGILRDLQTRSFAANTEFCGYIGRDPAGNLMATQALQGDEASCTLPQIPAGMTLLASFHTHGTYSPYYASEFPTTTDMLSDASDSIDGYIATPGGRLWYVDTDTMTTRQLCGRGCLPQDPGYDPTDDGPVQPVFTLQQLRQWEAG